MSLWNTHAVLLQLVDCGPVSGLTGADECRSDQVCHPDEGEKRLEKEREKKARRRFHISNGGLRLVGVAAGQMD